MQAVILAGGRGARLMPLTNELPKPMIPVQGKPFLEYLIRLIKSFDLRNILILAGYLGKAIEEYFGNGSNFDLKINYSYEKQLLGTGGALRNSEEMLENEFLLLNGDTFFPIDYKELINYFYNKKKIGVISAYANLNNNIANNLSVNNLNKVCSYNKINCEGMTHLDAGAMVFSKEIINFIPNGEVCSLEEDILPKLIKVGELMAFTTEQRFYDIGSFEGLELIEQVLKISK